MTDDRKREARSASDEFEEERRQRIITARLLAVALVLAALVVMELDRRSNSDSAQDATPAIISSHYGPEMLGRR